MRTTHQKLPTFAITGRAFMTMLGGRVTTALRYPARFPLAPAVFRDGQRYT
jgi:hypothetical protein